MDSDKTKFLKIVELELEDIKHDLEFLIESLNARHDDGLITDYVYRENLAFLNNELRSAQSVARRLAQLDPDSFESVDDLLSAAKEGARHHIATHDLPEALYPLIERKLNKVSIYLATRE